MRVANADNVDRIVLNYNLLAKVLSASERRVPERVPSKSIWEKTFHILHHLIDVHNYTLCASALPVLAHVYTRYTRHIRSN